MWFCDWPEATRHSELPLLLYGARSIPETVIFAHIDVFQSPIGKCPFDVDEIRLDDALIALLAKTDPPGDKVNPCLLSIPYNICILPRGLFACELRNTNYRSAYLWEFFFSNIYPQVGAGTYNGHTDDTAGPATPSCLSTFNHHTCVKNSLFHRRSLHGEEFKQSVFIKVFRFKFRYLYCWEPNC